jgi:hypothetical protein
MLLVERDVVMRSPMKNASRSKMPAQWDFVLAGKQALLGAGYKRGMFFQRFYFPPPALIIVKPADICNADQRRKFSPLRS